MHEIWQERGQGGRVYAEESIQWRGWADGGPLGTRWAAARSSDSLGCNSGRSRSPPCQDPKSPAAAWGRSDLWKIDVVPVLFLTLGPWLQRVGEGKETHPLGLTGQQEGLSCDERKNFLQGKVIKPWDELLREVVEGTS